MSTVAFPSLSLARAEANTAAPEAAAPDEAPAAGGDEAAEAKGDEAPAPESDPTARPPEAQAAETPSSSFQNPPLAGPEPTPLERPPATLEASEDESYVGGYIEPPPPPRTAEPASEIPEISIRIDPFNWLLAGRLGFEIEVAIWEFLSVEVVPILVTSEKPPTLFLSGREDNLTQHSDGLGPISGARLAAGFWLNGKPFRGTLLRAFITNYAYDYETRSAGVLIDRVGHTERHLGGTIGSYSRYGAFILGGEIGLGFELNDEERCYTTAGTLTGSDCNELHIMLDRPGRSVANLYGSLHPAYLEGRFSLGVVF